MTDNQNAASLEAVVVRPLDGSQRTDPVTGEHQRYDAFGQVWRADAGQAPVNAVPPAVDVPEDGGSFATTDARADEQPIDAAPVVGEPRDEHQGADPGVGQAPTAPLLPTLPEPSLSHEVGDTVQFVMPGEPRADGTRRIRTAKVVDGFGTRLMLDVDVTEEDGLPSPWRYPVVTKGDEKSPGTWF